MLKDKKNAQLTLGIFPLTHRWIRIGVPSGTTIIICDKNTFVNTFSKKIKASVFYTLAIVGLTIP